MADLKERWKEVFRCLPGSLEMNLPGRGVENGEESCIKPAFLI